MSDSKGSAAWHSRTKAPWICRWCDRHSPTTMLNQLHEPKCDLRVEEK